MQCMPVKFKRNVRLINKGINYCLAGPLKFECFNLFIHISMFLIFQQFQCAVSHPCLHVNRTCRSQIISLAVKVLYNMPFLSFLMNLNQILSHFCCKSKAIFISPAEFNFCQVDCIFFDSSQNQSYIHKLSVKRNLSLLQSNIHWNPLHQNESYLDTY